MPDECFKNCYYKLLKSLQSKLLKAEQLCNNMTDATWTVSADEILHEVQNALFEIKVNLYEEEK